MLHGRWSSGLPYHINHLVYGLRYDYWGTPCSRYQMRAAAGEGVCLDRLRSIVPSPEVHRAYQTHQPEVDKGYTLALHDPPRRVPSGGGS